MNLILGNLSTLKAYLLPASMQDDSERDGVIESLGLGVAGAFETFCDRKFARTVDDTEEFTGDRTALALARYPLEAAPATAVRHTGEAAFTTITGLVGQWKRDSGMVTLTATPGAADTVLRVTYTGGYWINPDEDGEQSGDDEAPLEEDDDTTLPATAFALPKALERAWLEQCRHVWTTSKLFVNTGENDAKLNAQVELDFLPTVEKTLRQYRRITL